MTDDLTVPDEIEVGRYALRTFHVGIGAREPSLKSLYQETTWNTGTMVAECRNREYTTTNRLPVVHYPPHKPPEPGCTCGVYGTLTLDQLHLEYGSRAHSTVAVIAAEGETVIGPKGLRTAAARIVAYWATDYVAGLVWKPLLPDIPRHYSMAEMLSKFNFPAYIGPYGKGLSDEEQQDLPPWGGEWPPDPMWVQDRKRVYQATIDRDRHTGPTHQGLAAGSFYAPPIKQTTPSYQVVQWGGATVAVGGGNAYVQTPAQAVAFSGSLSSETTYTKIKEVVKDTITPSGLNAIRHSLGLPLLDNP